MEKHRKKIIFALLIYIAIILLVSNVLAISTSEYKPDSLEEVTGADKFKNLANDIIGTVRVIGSIVSVGALIVIGIKYIMGSVEDKAEYKKTLKPYVIGAVLVFGITNILGIIQNIVGDF